MREHYDLVDFISIHALVKRATKGGTVLFDTNFISIHALVKRATVTHTLLAQGVVISIHALVKRATQTQISLPVIWVFQSTPS